MDAPNVVHLRGLTRRITSARCFPAKEEAMKSIPTEIVDRPMLVQEVGGGSDVGGRDDRPVLQRVVRGDRGQDRLEQALVPH